MFPQYYMIVMCVVSSNNLPHYVVLPVARGLIERERAMSGSENSCVTKFDEWIRDEFKTKDNDYAVIKWLMTNCGMSVVNNWPLNR